MNSQMNNRFECILSHGASLPKRGFPTDSGLDVTIQGYQRMINGKLSEITWFDEEPEDERNVILFPGRRLIVKTGLRINIPSSDDPNYTFEIQVRPKSGLALKQGIMIVNTPGTIDNTYRGDIDILIYNSDIWEQNFIMGQKIAQLVINRVYIGDVWEEVTEFKNNTDRSTGGFGSTGLF